MKRFYTTGLLVIATFAVLTNSIQAQTPGENPSSEGIHLHKIVETFDFSTFEGTIKMESFVEGEVRIISETQPQDIVLVLDVSTSMNDNLVSYSFSARNSQPYTYNGYGSNTYYYLHADGTYYPVRRSGGTNARRLSFTAADGTTYYLSGTTVSTTDNRRLGNYDTIWTGVLYSRSQTSRTKLSALKDAATSFINRVYSDAIDAEVDHRISIVTFAENATTQIGLTDVTIGRANMLNIVNQLRTANWTSSDRGMANAAAVLRTVTDATRGKNVVMFTDGVPCRTSGSGNTFELNVANGAIDNSHAMKQSGVMVYTVGVFSSPTDQTHKYMNFVSSNYPDAADMNSSPYNGTPSEGSYYMTARDSEELDNIFSAIAESISGGAAVTLDETTVLKDVFSSFCSLPSGVSGVTLKMSPCLSCTQNAGANIYTWGEETDVPSSVFGTVGINADGESYVDVSGFDYSENWCGLTTSGSVSTPHGNKLVVYVRFKLNVTPELQNVDPIYSNTSASGLYDKNGEPINGGLFDNPAISFGRIILKTSGLRVGDSALFKVTRGTGATASSLYDIVVIGTGTTTTTIIPLLMPNETYTVTENTDWGWTYSITDSSRSQSKTFGADGGTATFSFDNVWNEYPSNSEKSVKNHLVEPR